ncbi:N-acetyllactosaminide beta-1,3-N-acetylglucosaminyltransferase 2 [Archocentrus centrarchus]|uniref:N-acetyllactosaminide beta-1,3-N-acetylglucosaminyltransferase 2 n=1 Tax=Archocentrus centrarchus TaxID=63155 RepID=UPI0011E9FC00|nr:N-acetyllactosaminide beta-1,3-N-acetylglucosaminyltransferase 2-like [Archocentrus centrarchus]
MARCYCRWRRVLICLCTPCIFLILLFTYVSIMLCMGMNEVATPANTFIATNPHFVANGLLKNETFAPLPKTFWEDQQQTKALWNHLQQAVDYHFNPILHPKKNKRLLRNSSFYDFLLKRSFSEVASFDSVMEDFDKLPEQLQRFVRHMQRRDYPILHHPDGGCGAQGKGEQEPTLLLFAIKTTPANFNNRQAIRQTWGQVGWVAGQKINGSGRDNVGGYVRRVFLLGKQNTKELSVDVSELLKWESNLYGDILQWDFEDTFFNLTLKDVLFWSWFSRFCRQTRFVFKGDDDVFVNTPKLITYLQIQLQTARVKNNMQEFMIGEVIEAASPNRVNISKYFIPDSFYEGSYPTYAGGGGVVYSGQVARRLHLMSKRVHLFPIDDVFVGICMIRLSAFPMHHPAFLMFDFPKDDWKDPCLYHTVLVVHKRSPKQVVQLWAGLKETQAQCGDVPLRDEEKKNTSKTTVQLD